MSNFFKHFPTVTYMDYGVIKNITVRTAIDFTSKVPLLPHTSKAGQRADILADLYYDDPTKDWLVYYSNQTIDPWADQYMTDEQLDASITREYQSVERAGRLVKHWINDWRSDDSSITTTMYNSLPKIVKQLFDPVVDYRSTITGYVRKQEDLIRPTSLYLEIEVAGHDWVVGDEVEFIDGVVVGTGEVLQILDTSVIIHHVQDTYDVTDIRKRNGATLSFTTLKETPCITTAEAAYYKPETVYEHAVRVNESKRQMQLVDKRFADTAQEQLQAKLRA